MTPDQLRELIEKASKGWSMKRRFWQLRGVDAQLIADLRVLAPRFVALWEAAKDARNNLGVPQPGYPAPVAYAADVLDKALTALEEA